MLLRIDHRSLAHLPGLLATRTDDGGSTNRHDNLNVRTTLVDEHYVHEGLPNNLGIVADRMVAHPRSNFRGRWECCCIIWRRSAGLSLRSQTDSCRSPFSRCNSVLRVAPNLCCLRFRVPISSCSLPHRCDRWTALSTAGSSSSWSLLRRTVRRGASCGACSSLEKRHYEQGG